MITLKRAYDAKGCLGAKCFLVERLWPRGVKKEELRLDGWMQDVAPSHQLRRWFRHDPAKWEEFRHRYFAELDGKPAAWKPLAEAARHDNVALVYSSRDSVHNNAVALKQYLETKIAMNTQAA
ncbi:MAG: DUF488 domain-containing protein [Terriglobia bacterium]